MKSFAGKVYSFPFRGKLRTQNAFSLASLSLTLVLFTGIFLAYPYLQGVLRCSRTSLGVKTPSLPTLKRTQPGYFDATFWEQGLAHDQFHLSQTKRRLADLVRHFNRAAIVGVEGGFEVQDLAEDGYEVHAFEPMTKFVEVVQKYVTSKNLSNVHFYRMAATNVSTGFMTAKYITGKARREEKAPMTRVDDNISGGLDVLSADIQGGEWEVVQGSMKLVQGPGIRSMWIEIHPCNTRVLPMLQTLDDLGYALFDMVPIGATHETKVRQSLFEASRAMQYGWYSRPARYDEYFKWMCELRNGAWSWIQTDVVAIRRDILTDDVMFRLKTLASDVLQDLTSKK